MPRLPIRAAFPVGERIRTQSTPQNDCDRLERVTKIEQKCGRSNNIIGYCLGNAGECWCHPLKRHLTGYFGVLSSHSSLRSQCVPAPVPESTPEEEDKSSRTLPLSHYISWSQLLRRTFEIDTICPRCKSPLRLIAPIETEDTIKKPTTRSCPRTGAGISTVDRATTSAMARASAVAAGAGIAAS
jgi:hypothetical protein